MAGSSTAPLVVRLLKAVETQAVVVKELEDRLVALEKARR